MGDREGDIETAEVVEGTASNNGERNRISNGQSHSDEAPGSLGGRMSYNPRYNRAVANRSQGDEAPEEREERNAYDPDLPVAQEFGGYFANRDTMVMAYAVLIASVVAAIVVVTSQLYVLLVLDPPCSDVNVTGRANISLSCDPDDEGSDTTVTVLVILISFVIPACGLYGSMQKVVEILQIFRLLSAIFGAFSTFQLISALSNPSSIANVLSSCDVGEQCLTNYFILEIMYSVCYLFINVAVATLLIRRIEALEDQTKDVTENARVADVLRDAAIVRTREVNPNIPEDQYVHPLATVVRPGDARPPQDV